MNVKKKSDYMYIVSLADRSFALLVTVECLQSPQDRDMIQTYFPQKLLPSKENLGQNILISPLAEKDTPIL